MFNLHEGFLHFQTEHELGLLKMSLLFNFGPQEAKKLKSQSVACFVGHPVAKCLYNLLCKLEHHRLHTARVNQLFVHSENFGSTCLVAPYIHTVNFTYNASAYHAF